jgi:hypothetical protein
MVTVALLIALRSGQHLQPEPKQALSVPTQR